MRERKKKQPAVFTEEPWTGERLTGGGVAVSGSYERHQRLRGVRAAGTPERHVTDRHQHPAGINGTDLSPGDPGFEQHASGIFTDSWELWFWIEIVNFPFVLFSLDWQSRAWVNLYGWVSIIGQSEVRLSKKWSWKKEYNCHFYCCFREIVYFCHK